MDIEIVTKDNKKFRLSDIGMTATDFIVSSIKHDVYSQSIEGRHGLVDYGADYRDRTITVPFLFYPNDLHDFSHGRDELFEYLTGTESFYIRELRRMERKQYEFVKPFKKNASNKRDEMPNRYVNGKQYLVRLSNVVSLDQEESRAKGTLEFTTTMLPFAETRYTTMQIHNSGYNENENFGLVDGINTDYDKYRFTTNDFYVWNAGNVDVEPESMYLKVTVKGLNTNGDFKIANYTNGSFFVYKKAISNGTLVIDGLDVKLNNVNTLRDTSITFIKMNQLRNNIVVTNGTYESIEFDFRFYYK